MIVEWRFENKLIEYPYAVIIMEDRVSGIILKNSSELIWLLEHPSLYTAGTSAKSEEILAESTTPVFYSGRGGKYTYHGPGQRVVYLMLDLKKRGLCDVRAYISKLGCWIVNTLACFKVKGRFDSNRIGVWVDNGICEEKIAAFGIRIKSWVTYHGISVNISPDLEYYKNIVPCGLKDYSVGSMKKLGVSISVEEFDYMLHREFCKVFF